MLRVFWRTDAVLARDLQDLGAKNYNSFLLKKKSTRAPGWLFSFIFLLPQALRRTRNSADLSAD
jgi:hypothetical protein